MHGEMSGLLRRSQKGMVTGGLHLSAARNALLCADGCYERRMYAEALAGFPWDMHHGS